MKDEERNEYQLRKCNIQLEMITGQAALAAIVIAWRQQQQQQETESGVHDNIHNNHK